MHGTTGYRLHSRDDSQSILASSFISSKCLCHPSRLICWVHTVGIGWLLKLCSSNTDEATSVENDCCRKSLVLVPTFLWAVIIFRQYSAPIKRCTPLTVAMSRRSRYINLYARHVATKRLKFYRLSLLEGLSVYIHVHISHASDCVV